MPKSPMLASANARLAIGLRATRRRGNASVSSSFGANGLNSGTNSSESLKKDENGRAKPIVVRMCAAIPNAPFGRFEERESFGGAVCDESAIVIEGGDEEDEAVWSSSSSPFKGAGKRVQRYSDIPEQLHPLYLRGPLEPWSGSGDQN